MWGLWTEPGHEVWVSTQAHTRPPVAWDGPSIGKRRITGLKLVVKDWGSALPTLPASSVGLQ